MPKAKDEDAFMADLLSGLEDSFFNAVPTPDPIPKKKHPVASGAAAATSTTRLVEQRKTPVTQGNQSSISQANEENLDQLLEGAEGWDWNDMDDDFLSPKKVSPRKASPKKIKSTVRLLSLHVP